MQRSGPALVQSSAEAVGDSGGDTKLARVNWGSTSAARGAQTTRARTERGLQSLQLIKCWRLRVSFTIFMCCKNLRASPQREAKVCGPNLMAWRED